MKRTQSIQAGERTHTAGPWEIQVEASDRRVIRSIANPQKPVSIIVADSWVKDHDALLAASAPELLEALQSIKALAMGIKRSHVANVIAAKAQDAITKATGA
jgi:hypothetical protein